MIATNLKKRIYTSIFLFLLIFLIFNFNVILVYSLIILGVLSILEFSTLINIVVTPDILAANQSRRLYSDLLTMLFPKEMIQLIMNQYQKGHPVSPEVVGRQIGKPVFGVIPKDDQSCIRALSSSAPIFTFAKNSPFVQGINEFVRKLKQKNVLASLAKLKKPEAPKKKETSTVSSKSVNTKLYVIKQESIFIVLFILTSSILI